MGLYINHVNAVLGLNQESTITDLSTDTSTFAYKVQEAVKRAVDVVWNARQWSFKKRKTTFSTVAGTEEYNIPKTVGEIYSVRSSGAPYNLTSVSERNLDRFDPNPTGNANPERIALFELAGVESQPSSASTIKIVSSSASDTTQSVLVKGLVNDEIDFEEVSLNGTNAVNTTKQFSNIISLTKSADTAGLITFTSNADAVTNAVMARHEHTVRIRKMRMNPAPASVLTITLKFFAPNPILTHKWEDIEIPSKWDTIVNQLSYAYSLQYRGQEWFQESKLQENIANEMIKTHMAELEEIAIDEIIVPIKFNSVPGEAIWDGIPSGYGRELYSL